MVERVRQKNKSEKNPNASFAMDAVLRVWSKVLFENISSMCIDCFLLAENPELGLPLIYVTFKSLVLLSYSTTFQAKQLILVFLKTI